MAQSYDEENIRVQRYVDNEMTTAERAGFEKDLEENAALRDILAFEQNLLQLGRSAGDKIKKYYEPEKKNDEEERDILAMIMNARTNWEEKNESAAKPKISTPVSVEHKKTGSPVIKMQLWKSWAAAAAVISILMIGIEITRQPGSPEVAVNEQDKTENNLTPDTLIKKQNPEPANIAKEDGPASRPTDKAKPPKAEKAKLEELYAANFKPDTSPEDKSGPLETAFAHYDKRDYEKAAYAMNDKSRGEDKNEKLNNFYRHYYTALIFLADSNAIKAIPEFETAVNTSPNLLFKTKSQWYLALSNLKIGGLEKVNLLLSEIARKGNEPFKTKAIALKKALE